MAVSITSLPTSKPGNVTLKRGSEDNMELKWGLSVSNPGWQDLTWVFQASKNMSGSYREVRGGANYVTSDRLWIRDLGVDTRSFTQPYDRKKYHPVTLNRYLTSVTAKIILPPTTSEARKKHPIESNRYASVTFTFNKPKAPKWAELPSVDSTTGNVSCVLTAAADDYDKELYDTYYCVTRQDNFTSTYSAEKVIESWKSTKDGSTTVETAKTQESKSLIVGQWMRIKYEAYSRGLCGNSSTVTRSYVIAHPPKASITSITVSDVNDVNGIVTVLFNTNETEYRPVDTVILQRLSDTSINTKVGASNSNEWEDVSGAVDDGKCKGLTDVVADARPSRNKHVWYRVVTTRGIYSQYSDPVKAEKLETFSSIISDDVLEIDSVTPGDDGESLEVVFGWSDNDTNGTEITWSDKPDAWQSTEPPSSYNVPDTWEDSTSQVSEKDHSAKLVIRGLIEGVQYYIKARRYLETSDSIEYSDNYCTPLSDQYPAKTASKPTDVVLKAPAFVKRGDDFTVTWTYGGSSDQTEWILYKVTTSDNTTVKTAISSGKDANGLAVVSSDQLISMSDITLVVSITTGGDWTDSAQETITISDPPVIDVIASSTLTDQPMSFYVVTDCSNANLIAKIQSKGVFDSVPNGEVVQMDGDVVWGEKLSPSWTPLSDNYCTVITLPTGIPFINTVDYELFVSVEDPTTGFTSEDISRRFVVDWAHIASVPDDSSSITAVPDSKSVRISSQKPLDWADGDVYDVYRVSSDSIDRIVEGGVYGYDVVDRYAPFGKNVSLLYRIATRTKNGSVAWTDVPYDLYGYQLRFDWENGSIELPYNITINDSYTKNYEAHTHIDGSKSGHWNLGVEKKASFTTKVPRLEDREQVLLIRELAKYPGPVFVRTPDGSAFQANVNVKGLESSYDNLLVGVSIDVEELTYGRFFGVLPDDFILVQEPLESEDTGYERQQILYWGGIAPTQGDTFVLSEAPTGTDFVIDVITSYDGYTHPHILTATVSDMIVTLESVTGLPSESDLTYLVRAFYNVTQSDQETS